jgi:hypothetical protein
MNWVGIAFGVLNAVTTLLLYKHVGPDWALSNVAFVATSNSFSYGKRWIGSREQ